MVFFLKLFKRFKPAEDLHKSEEDLGKNIWKKLNVLEVTAASVPRSEIVAIEINSSNKELISTLKNSKLARIPVYQGNIDNIIGFIHIKDVIQNYDSNFSVSGIIREIIFVPAVIKLSGVLAKMKSSQVHVAIVLDEHGCTEGIITMTDIIEEIMGEIDDEHNDDCELDGLIEKINKNEYIAMGKVVMTELSDFLKINIDANESKYKTLNGVLLNFLTRMPKVGEAFTYNNVNFTILDADDKMIHKVLINIDTLNKAIL